MNHLQISTLSSLRMAAVAAFAATLLGACGGGGTLGEAAAPASAVAAGNDESLRIEGQPYPLAVKEGEPAMFAVTDVVGGGAAPLRYQWRRNGIDIPGANDDHLVLAGTSLADDGAQYTVVVSRGGASTVSKAGHLAVVATDADYPWP